MDISASSGISFVYKGTFGQGDTCAIKCESESVTELGASYNWVVPGSTNWKEVSLTWDDFLQPKWAEAVDLDLKRVLKIHWASLFFVAEGLITKHIEDGAVHGLTS